MSPHVSHATTDLLLGLLLLSRRSHVSRREAEGEGRPGKLSDNSDCGKATLHSSHHIFVLLPPLPQGASAVQQRYLPGFYLDCHNPWPEQRRGAFGSFHWAARREAQERPLPEGRRPVRRFCFCLCKCHWWSGGGAGPVSQGHVDQFVPVTSTAQTLPQSPFAGKRGSSRSQSPEPRTRSGATGIHCTNVHTFH